MLYPISGYMPANIHSSGGILSDLVQAGVGAIGRLEWELATEWRIIKVEQWFRAKSVLHSVGK